MSGDIRYSKQYVQAAASIIESYKGNPPFATYLKNTFKQQKKFGSRDRKAISQLCFSFFRLGKSFEHLDLQQRLETALFLTTSEPLQLLEAVHPEWNRSVDLPIDEKLAMLNGREEAEHIFPVASALSKHISSRPFQLSHFVQPLLFLRLRPGTNEKIISQLEQAGLENWQIEDNCIALPNGTKATELLHVDRDVVVQDYSSQRVLQLLPAALFSEAIAVWDCCAASGGKSLLLFDQNPKIRLTVSDVRESILVNLRKRFAEAGLNAYRSFTLDVAVPDVKLPVQNCQLVICDAPCSGSGTWGRTPEQMTFFTADKLDYYSSLQKRIAVNAVRALAKGGYFLYITCSVYQNENEGVVEYLLQHTPLQLKATQYIIGYERQADTLFTALFQL